MIQDTVENLIDPISLMALKAELTSEIFVRPTNNGSNEIYIFEGDTKPNLMAEVGRLRELTFRLAGGGTGKSLDIDEFDTGNYSYSQLIVWDPNEEKIVGGYRFVKCDEALDEKGKFHLSTSEIVTYSENLKFNYFPFSIELGRSFVQPEFQPSSGSRKGLFSLDNLWDGLGAMTISNPTYKYFFGKITMYSNFNREARDTLLHFMHYFFPDNEKLVTVLSPIQLEYSCDHFLKSIQGLSYKEAHKLLNHRIRELGENIPPLFNSYMNLSPTMRTFGTAINHHFGDVEETGIMICIDEIYDQKKERHINTYLDWLKIQQT